MFGCACQTSVPAVAPLLLRNRGQLAGSHCCQRAGLAGDVDALRAADLFQPSAVVFAMESFMDEVNRLILEDNLVEHMEVDSISLWKTMK